jgi:hypothetical protein
MARRGLGNRQARHPQGLLVARRCYRNGIHFQ